MGFMWWTARRLFHLKVLQDGDWHAPKHGETSDACFTALAKTGMAEMTKAPRFTGRKTLTVKQWRITDAGRKALQQSKGNVA